MKKLHILLFVLCACLLLQVPAAAVSSASDLKSSSTVTTDGKAQVSITAQLHLDNAVSDLYFPIPGTATDVLLNGSPAQTKVSGQQLLVVLSAGAGNYTVNISYTLPNAVTIDKGIAVLTLPLLSGFAYPITSMEFSVTLPCPVSGRPSFTSGYHQTNIASSILLTVSENTVYGYLQTSLKDHETLVMTLQTDASAFPELTARQPLLSAWGWAVLISTLVAIAYYCITLMPKFPRKTRAFSAPEGITAGDVGTCMTGCGTDLTMLVISWAQLGYLAIETDGKSRVTLHKRMEMGNERSNFEVRCFQSLFGARQSLDGTGLHYAKLCRKMAGKSYLLREFYDPRSGSPNIYRMLAGIPGLICGLHMGISIGESTGAKTLLALLMGALCIAFSYFIQSGGKCLPLRDKRPLLMGLGCGAMWMVLGVLTKELSMVLPVVAFQLLSGFAAAFGGKRSELGLRSLAQIQALRHHMVSAKPFELQQLMQKNPNYFYELAPYALALGVDRSFARRFGKNALPESSFLITGSPRVPNAAQWAAQLRKTADILNTRQQKLPYEQLTRK